MLHLQQLLAKFPLCGTELTAQLCTEKSFSNAWDDSRVNLGKKHLFTELATYGYFIMDPFHFWSVWVLMSPSAQVRPLSKVAFDRPRIFTTKGTNWWKQLKVFRATTHPHAQGLRALGEDYSIFILFCCRDMDLLQRRGLRTLKRGKCTCSTHNFLALELTRVLSVDLSTYEDQLRTEMSFSHLRAGQEMLFLIKKSFLSTPPPFPKEV